MWKEDEPWIYHERQEAHLCGQHALNNLAQIPHCFEADYLATIAHELAAIELSMYDAEERRIRLREGSHYVDDSGNFSIEVLKAAIEHRLGVTLTAAAQNQEITTFQGFLCHKSDHWFAIRNIGGRFWNLNSTIERPEVVSHFTLGSEMEVCREQGYTVFFIQSGLPEGGTKTPVREGLANWHRLSDLMKGRNSQPDPWDKLTGKGQRLDGRSGRTSSDLDSLSEDELLQMALQQSLALPEENMQIPPEPPNDATNAVRIQFRLPSKPRVVRRFLDTDTVAAIYAFCENLNDAQAIHLHYGFPPKDLASLREKTIAEANLANETIQGRIV